MSRKLVAYFSASGGSGFGKTASGLKDKVPPQAKIVEGKLLNGRQSVKGLSKWVKELGL